MRNTAMPASAVRLAVGSATPRERLGDRPELDELALLQFGVGRDHRCAATGELEAVLQGRAAGLQGHRDGVEWRGVGGGVRQRLEEDGLELVTAAEEHLALVGEV